MPSIPGQRVTVEVSSDLQTWTMAMPYNSPRGFIRARTSTNANFGTWITAADAATGSDVAIFSNGLRNAQCWGAAWDITPFCTSAKAGVLVSPCHVLFVTHWHPEVGDVVQWVTSDNQLISRTLTALVSVPEVAYLNPDITVGRIDVEVSPASVPCVRVFSDNALRDWEGYLVPVVFRDQFNTLHEADVYRITSFSPTVMWLQAPISPIRLARYKEIQSGDSGSPVCVVDAGKLVLLMMISQGGSGRGTFLPAYIDPINAAMTTLGGGYQLTLWTP